MTKHILKHHKKEQNAYIEGNISKKILKNTVLIFLKYTNGEIFFLQEIMDEENDKNRSFLLSLGLDSGSMDLRSNSPEEENSSIG
ncbi:unnamed protein product [Dracunculus medinensis]|uniref:Uncharacterized protein n=1 Tax=Dracunculus medinensis TaxID=318479 RepID=A0A3P7SSB9_DRAME|nr:unnamed protein product [Dracunculus medinensis]